MELPLAPNESTPGGNQVDHAMLERSVCRSFIQLAEVNSEREVFEDFDWLANPDLSELPLANPIDNMTSEVTLEKIASMVSGPFSLILPRTIADERFAERTGYQTEDYELMRLGGYKAAEQQDERLKSGELQRLSARDILPQMPSFFMAQYQDNLGSHDGTCSLPAAGQSDDQMTSAYARMRTDWLDEPKFNFIALRENLKGAEKPIVAGTGIYSMGNIGFITDCHVLQSHRGKQLGSLLLSLAVEDCARALYDHVVFTRPKGCPAIPFFERKGFQVIGGINIICPI